MRARTLNDLLNKHDRAAVSNVTGREASKVTMVTQRYGGNIVGGWALGKGGDAITVEKHPSIPVFSSYGELIESLPPEKHPNKVTIYSPPDAVYGDVKSVLNAAVKTVETIFIITENVSIEVSAKIYNLCREQNVDVIGCNTLGVINPKDHVRVGAVGGDQPEETFRPGCVTIISNSGNMVNTMASYLWNAGLGVRFGISTGKDHLILTPLRELLQLAMKDAETKLIVLYVEPGGLYERAAIEWMTKVNFPKPVIVYVGGTIADERELSLGHAGAVVEGRGTSARDKIALFDTYLGTAPYTPGMQWKRDKPRRGLRIQALHDLPAAAFALCNALKIPRDYRHYTPLQLNPWLIDMQEISATLPPRLVLSEGVIPSPYREQFAQYARTQFGRAVARRDMRNASHASSNDGATPRIYGRSVLELMDKYSFAKTLILSWTGHAPARSFEPELVEQTLIASLTNGPGTISAQAAKLSASAGNEPHVAMIATLAAIGAVHGGNGQDAAALMIDAFAPTELTDPYDAAQAETVKKAALATALTVAKRKQEARETDAAFERVPCLGHPVYKNDDVNYDPRERVISAFLSRHNIYHAFLDFYHRLAQALYENGVTRNVLAVNVDAAIACVWLGICWPLLVEKKITVERVKRISLLAFALGRAAGGAAEYLDHADYGLPMDMRLPVTACETLTAPRELNGVHLP